MKYAIVMRQAGGGCDHTIACGTRFEEFEATDDREAGAQARARMHSDDAEWLRGEVEIERLTLVRVVCDLPVQLWRNDVAEADRQQAQQREDEAARAQYERLRGRFGGKP